MSDYAVRMIADNGTTTAKNAAISSTTVATAIGGGGTVLISIGAAGALFFRFGTASDTVTTSNGFLLAAGGSYRFSVPSQSSHIHAIRASVDTTISLQLCDGGI